MPCNSLRRPRGRWLHRETKGTFTVTVWDVSDSKAFLLRNGNIEENKRVVVCGIVGDRDSGGRAGHGQRDGCSHLKNTS